MKVILAGLLVFALMSTTATADSNTVLSGHVYLYGTNAGIADAHVTAASIGETRSGRTDKSGHFVFLGLLAGLYTVSVVRDGYNVCITSRVFVMPGESEYLTAPMTRAMLDSWTHGNAVGSSASYVIY